ncbi:hypothetical protein LTR37_004373 [Vermiconidia calcicola]|uniref:Uncharacterized protein n=1 Tax=Vermiconidia calcicola TaxID=1690605 RepID=A0ACC3NMR2_9PEZI|nr:hypothetical protein LTR37_004373 [Vermiconidia calcicola]
MAAEAPTMPVNGYAPHHGYGGIEQQQNSFAYSANSNTPSQATSTHPPPASNSTPATSNATSHQSDVPKDEVGWYFVEQYYTTLSRSPEKLYLFYNKRSQFVSGQETDKVTVCVGQRAINDRIKELDFQDCKVRVTNVDSQASDSNIVIQVIGEISNKSQPHKKFTQTFVLATQTNGYFVLNDIFRYLVDEEDEPEQEAEPVAEEVQQVPAAESGYQEPTSSLAEVEPKGLTSSTDPAAIEDDAKQVDRELEQKGLIEPSKSEEQVPPTVNGVTAEEEPAAEPEVQPAEDKEDEAAAAVIEAEQPTTTEATPPAPKEEELKPEQPKAPEQTPAVSPPKQAASPAKEATPQPAPAPKPAAPKTWASLAASANRVATPAASSSASSSTSQTKPAPSSGKPTTTPAPTGPSAPAAPPVQPTPTAPAAQRDDASPAEGSQGDEWTAVGSSHNRQQSRQVNHQQEQPQSRGYIKNVHENIDGNELKAHLETYGELIYFDISRTKNCAFVDFKSPDGYSAAVNANPHNISGERLIVEERRIRGPPFAPRGQFQGGTRGRGGPGQGAPRGGFQGRGGYAPRGGARGGAEGRGGPGGMMPRGRGSSQAI